MSKTYESTVEYNEDFDEYYITIPQEVLDHLGWEEEDILDWQVNKDGTILLSVVDKDFYEGESDE